MNRSDLVKILAKEANLSEKNAEKLILSFCDTLADALRKDEKVVYSNFGTFYTVHYPSKVIYHPVLGAKKKMVMLPTDAVKWMPSNNIKEMVDLQTVTSEVTKFGSTKKFKQNKKEAGLPERKAKEVQEETIDNIDSDEPIEIPIRIASKKASVAIPIEIEDEDIKDIVPFAAGSNQITYVDLSDVDIPKEILCLVPEEIARKMKVIPIDLKDEMLILGMADPRDLEAVDLIKKAVRKKVSPRLISSADLNKIFTQYQKVSLMNGKETPENIPSENLEFSKSAPAYRILSLILKQALRENAERIHFEPQDDEVKIQYRIDGEIVEKTKLSKSLARNLLSKIRSLSDKEDRPYGPMQGVFSIHLDKIERFFEFVSLPVASGEKIVISPKEQIKKLKKIAELELRDNDYEKIKENIGKKGLILITSTKEINRLTTLYAILDALNNKGLSIASIESRASLILPGVTQIEVIQEKGFSYDNVLESIIKLDPDVVAIDQFNNRYIIEQCLALSKNKIVIALADSKDSIEAVRRLNELGINKNMLFSSLNLIIAEKPARQICQNCRTSQKTDPKTIRKIKEILSTLPSEEKTRIRRLGSRFYEGKGCKECGNSGFKNELSLFETLNVTEKIKDLVSNGADLDSIKKEAAKEGMTTLVQDGIIKALVGLTEVKNILEK
jgi:type IV pilus assembly protein PilB